MIYGLVNESTGGNYLNDITLHKFSESTSLLEASAIAIIEMEKSWNEIIQEGAIDLLQTEINNQYGVVNEADDEAGKEEGKNIFEKIVGMFKTFFAWVASIIGKAMEFIGKFIKSNSFLVKDESVIKAGFEALTDEERKVKCVFHGAVHASKADEKTDWAVLCGTKDIITIIKDADVGKTNDYKNATFIEKMKESIRSNFAAGATTDATLKELLAKKFDTTPAEFVMDDDSVITIAFVNLKNSDKARKSLKEEYDKIKKYTNGAIKEIKKAQKEVTGKLSADQKHCVSTFRELCKCLTGAAQRSFNAKIAYNAAVLKGSRMLLLKCYNKGASVAKKEKGKKPAAQNASAILSDDFFNIGLI